MNYKAGDVVWCSLFKRKLVVTGRDYDFGGLKVIYFKELKHGVFEWNVKPVIRCYAVLGV